MLGRQVHVPEVALPGVVGTPLVGSLHSGARLASGATGKTYAANRLRPVAGGLPVVLDDGSRYVYGAGLISQHTGANTYYYLSDGLGSTMKTVDAAGTVVNGYTYDVYGKKTSSTGDYGEGFGAP